MKNGEKKRETVKIKEEKGRNEEWPEVRGTEASTRHPKKGMSRGN